MANPFEKRATEYLREEEAFLAVVTPEPFATFLGKPAAEERLYDRLTVIIGTPGSGKTTLARVLQYATLMTLLRNQSMSNYKPLVDILTICGALSEERPTLVGARIPLEAEYREFWELPYSEELRISLMIAFLEARTVLAWLRNIEKTGVTLQQIEIVARSGSEAALASIGGNEGLGLLKQARKVELLIYRILAALVPPPIEQVAGVHAAAYRPFDVIEAIRINSGVHEGDFVPLVIFDDAHSLHPIQFRALKRWLTRRELKIARWMLLRLDALHPNDVLLDRPSGTGETGLERSRELTVIWMQSARDRANRRRAFRKMAKGMARRYLNQMDAFNRRGLENLGDLLSSLPKSISASRIRHLERQVAGIQRRSGISDQRRFRIESKVDEYLARAGQSGDDLRLAILSILLERYTKRMKGRQKSLFDEETEDTAYRLPLKVDARVADGARVHLTHKYERPYYFGIDSLCDASTENAEQFLRLASQLVTQSETQLIRGKDPIVSSRDQHKLLRGRALEMMDEWDFPEFRSVRRLADGIGKELRKKSLEGNASLGGGASAFGILEEEFRKIPETNPQLARTLKFGVAYNAFVLVPGHITKGRHWCLIELGGVLLLHYGLTLRRGGFLEGQVQDLMRFLKES